MSDYQVHPSVYGIEVRDGQSVDDYIAKARGFRSTAQLIEYREASAERQAEIRGELGQGNSADSGDQDRRRVYELLRMKNV